MRTFLSLFIAALLTSCGVSINYDYDQNTDFKKYQTYAYYNDMETGLTTLDERRLIRALDTILHERRYRKAERPDFLIDIKGLTSRTSNQSSVGVGVGSTGGNTVGTVGINVPLNSYQTYDEMMIEFVDETNERTFWVADLNVILTTSNEPEQRYNFFKKLAEKILRHYPPTAK
jgi:hypothetical protein